MTITVTAKPRCPIAPRAYPQQAEQAVQAMQSRYDVANVTFTEKARHRDGHVDITINKLTPGVGGLPPSAMTQTRKH